MEKSGSALVIRQIEDADWSEGHGEEIEEQQRDGGTGYCVAAEW
jgi:hypothetical protein